MKTLCIRIIGCLIVLGSHACSDIQAPDSIRLPQNEVILKLRFTTKAVMIEKGDSLALPTIATFNDKSQVEIGHDSIMWSSVDSTRVDIDSMGRIRALVSSPVPIDIIARYHYKGVTRADTVPVYVTETKIDADDIRIVALDSTNIGALALTGKTPKLRIDLYRGGAVSKEGVQIPLRFPKGFFMPSPTIMAGTADVYGYTILNNSGILGKFYIHASVNLYGNEVRDSIEFKGIYPAGVAPIGIAEKADGTMNARDFTLTDPVAYLQPCAITKLTVLTTTKTIDVVFSDSLSSPGVGCDAIPDADFAAGILFTVKNSIGGNVTDLTPGRYIVVRRSPTVGQVSYYLRDAVTKERLNGSGRYNQK